MSRLNRCFTRLALSLALTTVVALGAALPAFASDGTTAGVTGGSLGITNPAADNFLGVTLNGQAQSTTAALATFSVTDARGSGAGWYVHAHATTFTGASHSLSTGSLQMSEPGVTANGTTSPVPSVENGPYIIDVASPALIASAATDAGMGQYDFDPTTLTLSLPANTYADTYASTVTISADIAP